MPADRILYTRRSERDGARADRMPPGSWHQIRRGAHYPADEWSRLDDGERHRLLIEASARLSRAGLPCLSHVSAAHWWGLPVLGRLPDQVSVRVQGDGRSSRGVLRVHRSPHPVDVVEHRGLAVTDVATTVLDIARSAGLRAALVTADAAVRQGLLDHRTLIAAAEALPAGRRGRSTARRVALLVDGRSESPLESLSRAVMFRHRLAPPRLQVTVRDSQGFIGRADFGWEGLVGECDGAMKYGADVSGGDPSRAVYREKLREDRMRRVVDVARWGWQDALHETPLVRLLRSRGVPVVAEDAWFASLDHSEPTGP